MFIFPSKPNIIYDPNKLISTLLKLGKLKNWKAQLKKNGSRAIIWIDKNKKVTIYDRRNTLLTAAMEKDWSHLKIFPANTILDGELIGRKQGEISNRLYLWDMPFCGGEDLTKYAYDDRYKELIFIFGTTNYLESFEWIFRNYSSVIIGIAKMFPAEDWVNIFKNANYNGSTGENEGIVFKNITHHLYWDRLKTRDISEQIKFLFKYYGKGKIK